MFCITSNVFRLSKWMKNNMTIECVSVVTIAQCTLTSKEEFRIIRKQKLKRSQ